MGAANATPLEDSSKGNAAEWRVLPDTDKRKVYFPWLDAFERPLTLAQMASANAAPLKSPQKATGGVALKGAKKNSSHPVFAKQGAAEPSSVAVAPPKVPTKTQAQPKAELRPVPPPFAPTAFELVAAASSAPSRPVPPPPAPTAQVQGAGATPNKAAPTKAVGSALQRPAATTPVHIDVGALLAKDARYAALVFVFVCCVFQAHSHLSGPSAKVAVRKFFWYVDVVRVCCQLPVSGLTKPTRFKNKRCRGSQRHVS
jgi:hypothetical protein